MSLKIITYSWNVLFQNLKSVLICWDEEYASPPPHPFVAKPLKSSLMVDLTTIVCKLEHLMPLVDSWIANFTETIITNSVNITITASHEMIADVPKEMPEDVGQLLGRRIMVLDRLINTQLEEGTDLIKKGFALEEQILKENPNYTSQILDKARAFDEIKAKYKY